MDKINWQEAAECLKILAHPHRLQVIFLLLQKKRSVGELAEACGVLQNVMSEHLTLMKYKGFIEGHKEGRKVFYSPAEPALASIIGCIEKRFTQSK